MKMFSLAFRNLFRNFRRTIAIIATVAMGSGALFAFDGFIRGVQKDFKRSTIHSQYGNGQIHTSGYRETVYEDPVKHWITNYGELEYFLEDQEGVEYIFPRVGLNGMLMHNKKSISGSGLGIDGLEEAEFFDSLHINEGKMLEGEKNGILLGKGLARALNAHPGDTLKLYTKSKSGGIKSAKLDVTGTFHTGNADFDNRVFRIQLTKAQELLKTDRIESVAIGLSDHKHWEKVSAAVQNAFPHLEASSFAELNKIWYQHSMDWLNAQYHIIQIIILAIVLLGIFNTISASVLERKQEIGNLRANGESIKDVLSLIVYEGFFLGVFGGLLGLVLTYIVAKGFLHRGILMPPGPGQTKQFYISFQFDHVMALSTMALSILSATFAALLAGIKVARMPIAKALRSY